MEGKPIIEKLMKVYGVDSQVGLAKEIGAGQDQVCRWYNGEVNGTLWRIISFLLKKIK